MEEIIPQENMKYILLLLIFILFSSCAFAEEYYELNEQIWEKNEQTGVKNKIIDRGENILFSSDKTKFLYSFTKDKNATEYDAPKEIHIYNIKTKEDKILNVDTGYPNFRYINWSPDDKYIVFGSSTDVIGQNIIVNSTTGQELTNDIVTREDSFAWINNNEIVYSDIQDLVQNNLLIQTGTLTIINITTNTKKVLKQGDADRSYNFLKLVDNKILFSAQIYKERSKNSDPISSTYWLIDRDGKNEKQVEAEYQQNGWQLK